MLTCRQAWTKVAAAGRGEGERQAGSGRDKEAGLQAALRQAGKQV
jgi:hypothetical protein